MAPLLSLFCNSRILAALGQVGDDDDGCESVNHDASQESAAAASWFTMFELRNVFRVIGRSVEGVSGRGDDDVDDGDGVDDDDDEYGGDGDDDDEEDEAGCGSESQETERKKEKKERKKERKKRGKEGRFGGLNDLKEGRLY
ncbi:unnamed protein product [Trifolium pratense]|uniref:Uncharacterized protein n=1 Tax=Trifolium pratense TaxID=57577 RepID=A0ACB0IL94_TRIPR|nr:unnamed protein product [Trifolium pratense]